MTTSLLLLIITITSMAAVFQQHCTARPIIYSTAKMINSEDDGGNQNLLVSEACNHTIYTQVCLSSLSSDPRSQSATDLQGIAEIALDLSTAYGVNAVASVNKMKSNYSASNYVLGCLSDCLEEYSDAISNLQDSMEALKKKSYDTVNELVSGAMTDSDTCEDGFKDMAEGLEDTDQADQSSPLTSTNQYFFQLCSNVLAITNLLV